MVVAFWLELVIVQQWLTVKGISRLEYTSELL